ncbi:MAG: LysM peptidoglycan-binding domain-containing protein [Ilumatobacteraceae bacterium]
MTAALASDFSHYQYSGYSCVERGTARAAHAYDVRLPRRLTAPTGRPAGQRRPRALSADRAAVAVIHVRRRVVAALAFTGTMLLLWLGAGTVLANRGDDPASVSSVRPGATHIAAPGESLWTIAEQYRGATDIVVYVEQLIDLNGGEAGIQVGQQVQLP